METNELTLKEALQKINELGYKYIRIAYYGAGDSGDIENPDFYSTADDADHQRIEGLDWEKHYEEQTKRRTLCEGFMKPIQIKVDTILNNIEDWWNNDGGNGHVIIETNTGSYTIENNINITEQETYNHEGTIE